MKTTDIHIITAIIDQLYAHEYLFIYINAKIKRMNITSIHFSISVDLNGEYKLDISVYDETLFKIPITHVNTDKNRLVNNVTKSLMEECNKLDKTAF